MIFHQQSKEIMNTNTPLNEFYIQLNSIKNLFEVLLQSMNYCQENDINTYNNNELAEEIKVRIYALMEDIDNYLTPIN